MATLNADGTLNFADNSIFADLHQSLAESAIILAKEELKAAKEFEADLRVTRLRQSCGMPSRTIRVKRPSTYHG